jgi:hypothetical protein
MAGLLRSAEKYKARFPKAAFTWNAWAATGPRCPSRAAANSSAVGRTAVPPAPVEAHVAGVAYNDGSLVNIGNVHDIVHSPAIEERAVPPISAFVSEATVSEAIVTTTPLGDSRSGNPARHGRNDGLPETAHAVPQKRPVSSCCLKKFARRGGNKSKSLRRPL